MGRPAEGLDHLHYAMRLSPRDPSMPSWLGMAGGAELELEHYDKAIEYLDRALAFDPGQPRILLVLVGAHALAGNMSEARAKLAQLQKTQPHLTGEQLVTRFFGAGGGPGWLRLKEALQLALAPASERATERRPGRPPRTRREQGRASPQSQCYRSSATEIRPARCRLQPRWSRIISPTRFRMPRDCA